jgi:hypothetical protein
MTEPVGNRRPALRFASQLLDYELVQIQDLASILDVSLAQIRKFIALERLRVTRVGRSIKIHQTEALRFLATFGVVPERTPRM